MSAIRILLCLIYVCRSICCMRSYRMLQNELTCYYNQLTSTVYTQRKGNRNILLFYSNTTHLQSTNIAYLSLEVLDLDFEK